MPARLRDLMAVCARLGIEVKKPNRGSHWKATKTGFRVYPIPAHNAERTEITDEYIRTLCRHFGLDYKEMKRLLGQ
jgi:hypothetical protein